MSGKTGHKRDSVVMQREPFVAPLRVEHVEIEDSIRSVAFEIRGTNALGQDAAAGWTMLLGNAHLFAAAPAMLEALRHADAFITSLLEGGRRPDDHDAMLALRMYRAAIAATETP